MQELWLEQIPVRLALTAVYTDFFTNLAEVGAEMSALAPPASAAQVRASMQVSDECFDMLFGHASRTKLLAL